MSRAYFDLAVPDYSFAEYAAGRGAVVVLIDHPGVGGSDAPIDGWTLTPRAVGAVDAVAGERVLERLRRGAVDGIEAQLAGPVVGVGHSTGASILIHLQAQHRSYDAISLLGWAGGGLPEVLTEAERRLADTPFTDAELVAVARERWADPLPQLRSRSAQTLVATELSPDVRHALAATRAPLLAVAGTSAMIPGSAAPAARQIEVPVFLGIGEHDIARDAHAIPACFPAAKDITLFVLPGAGHNHNAEPARELMWARMLAWVAAVGELPLI
jgi:pimeloyl-ACP methyl ester carboxylesterase